MPEIRVYSRRGCHLCEQLIDELLPLAGRRLEVTVLDIDSRPDWQRKYDCRVPVVEFAGETICEGSLDGDAIRALLQTPPGATRTK